MVRIAFDVDGTLRDENYQPRPAMVELVSILLGVQLEYGGIEVIVWSGGGLGYAEQAMRDMGLPDAIPMAKPYSGQIRDAGVDIAFDDEQGAELAKLMVIVRKGRI